MDELTSIQGYLMDAMVDMRKFLDGNNAAGARVRKNLLHIKDISHELRKEISKIKKQRTK